MSLKIAFDIFEKEFSKSWQHYIDLDKELMVYRGVDITKENIEEINRIVIGLQDCYESLHPFLSFVTSCSIPIATLIKEHKKFMDEIKLAGGAPVMPDIKEKEAEA